MPFRWTARALIAEDDSKKPARIILASEIVLGVSIESFEGGDELQLRGAEVEAEVERGDWRGPGDVESIR